MPGSYLRVMDAFTTSVLGSITDGFLVVEADWTIAYANDRMIERFRRPREAILHANLWALFPDAVGQVAYVNMQRAMETRVATEYEVYYEPWNAWFLDRAYPVPNRGLAVYSQDITERKRFERILASERHVLEQVARGASLSTVLAEVCTFVEALDPTLRCAVRLPDAAPEAAPAPCVTELPIIGSEGTVVASLAIDSRRGEGASTIDPQLLLSATQLTGIAIDRQTAIARQEQAEARFRATFDQAAVGVAHVGVDGRWLQVNERLASMLGYDVTELTQYRFHDVTFHEDLELDVANVNRLLDGSLTTYTMEKRYVRRNGTLMWGNLTVSLVRTAAGAPDFFIAVVEDISARKQAEEALRVSERKLASILEQLPVGVGMMDTNGVLSLSNALMRRYVPERIPSRDEAQRRRWRAWRPDGTPLPPEEWPGARALRGEMVSPGVEFLFTQPDGRETWTTVGTSPLVDADGTMTGALLVIQDIDAIKAAESTLRYQSDLMQSITDNATTAIFMMDDRSRCTFMNPAAEQMTGYTFAEVRGGILHDFIHHHYPDGRPFPMTECPIDRALPESNEVHNHEDLFFRKDGEAFPVVCNARVIYERGAAVGTVIEVRDVTTDRASAEELRRLMDDLTTADQKKDEFLATLAHELRNPLAPIRNGLQLMQVAADDPAIVTRARAMMERQVGQMAHLIDDLMDLSRISRGSIVLQRRAFAIHEAVQDAVEQSKPLMDERRHALQVTLPPNPVVVNADRTRLAQVFANLLMNAAKYTPPGGTIELLVREGTGERAGDGPADVPGGDREGDTGVVEVRVRDNGAGIPTERLHEIFDMFAQVHRSFEGPGSGLGIGLSIVKRLVEMHEGRIEAYSAKPGTGSEFVVRLPLAPREVAVPAPTTPALPTAGRARYRLLVVDDNRDSANSLADLLTALGNEVRVAYEGAGAVALAQAFRPHAVLMDLGMPGVNGYDSCRRMRQLPGGEHLVLVAQTGWGHERDRRKSQEAGFDLHLVKPIDTAALLAFLDEAVR